MNEFEKNSTACPVCGVTNEAGAKFCTQCGAVIGNGVEEVNIVEAEEVSTTPWTAQEININYEPVANTSQAEAPESSTPVYYQSTGSANNYGTGNGSNNIGFSIASMVCGILSLLCCCFWYFAIILAIAGIVLGVISLKNGYAGRGMAIAGIATAGVAVVFSIIVLILAGIGVFADFLDTYSYY